MSLRILQIIPTLDRAGAEKQLVLLATGLPREEFDVHVCALTRGGPYEAELRRAGIPVTVIGKRSKLDPVAYWQLEKHIARLRPDIVQTWLFAAGSYGRVAARRCGVRHLVDFQGATNPHRPWYEWAIDRRLARSTSAIVAVSQSVADYLVQGGIPREKIRVIYGGVALDPVTQVVNGKIRAELGIPDNAKLLAIVGRLSPEKRIKDAIWAADLLKVCRDDVHLLVIGDGPLRERLLRYRDQIDIRDRVHFLGERSDVRRILSELTALWLTSEHEGLPNAVLEAMAAGIPAVASDIPGNRELVQHEQTGYRFAVGDRAALARHTMRLLDDPALARRLGEAGRRRAEEKFSLAGMLDSYAQLYRSLVTKDECLMTNF